MAFCQGRINHSTKKLLEEISYVNTKVYSNSDFVILPNRHIFSKFVKAVVMKTYLERLSPDNNWMALKKEEIKQKHPGS